ncbi:MAG TPA: tetratricopeptide repeat protein [Acidobacteriota bacterium]|nr:tetratricopeptide repeat protein [Acidobacteriota bacterium]
MDGDAPYPGGYTTRQVGRLLGIPDYAVRGYVYSGLISPRRGTRAEYRYSFQDLVVMRMALELCSRLSPRRVFRDLRRFKTQLPEGRSLSTLQINVEGEELVVRNGDECCNSCGQRVFDFDLSELAEKARPLARANARRSRRDERAHSADSWFETGRDLEQVDRCEAAQAYMRALRLNPFHLKAHINLGRLRHESGALNEAVAHYRNALKASPRDVTAAFNLAVALQDMDLRQEALEAYRQLLSIEPRYADAHYNISRLYEDLGRRKEALRHMTTYRNLVKSV